MKKNRIFTFFLIIIGSSLQAGNPIKIMPVGNSITAGEHYHFPANEERTGYRKDLFEMLINAGYNVDFVGSQTHGIRPINDKDWYDWNCEAYPGWDISSIASRVKIALPIYKPDILLVHVGTNGKIWDIKPGQVMDMLDTINKFSVDNDHPMTVFLCKIINRYYEDDQTVTTKFNTDMADAVAARTGDHIKIIMVDMEKGIGLDYTDKLPDPTANPPYEGGDMWGKLYPGVAYDHFHPNDKGNTKMAVKFYEELVKVLEAPEKVENNKVEGEELMVTSDNFIQISWVSNFLDEDGFIIERATTGSDFSVLDTVAANTRFFIDTTVILTNEYKYRIKAFNSTIVSQYSSEVTYTPIFFELTITVIGQGTVDQNSGSYLDRTKITLTATPSDGWKFDGWSDGLTGKTNPRSFTLVSDKTVTATFSEILSNINTQSKSACCFYPNPVKDKLEIELNNEFSEVAEIELFDNTGRMIFSIKVHGLKYLLNMENYNPGLYLIKVINKNNVTIVKPISKQNL